MAVLRMTPIARSLPGHIMGKTARPVPPTLVGSPPLKAATGILFETMYDGYRGIGLSAPMIGLGLQLVIADLKAGPIALVNPKIVAHSRRTESMFEGNLSIPGVSANVERPVWIQVCGTGLNGRAMEFRAHGLDARILLHEMEILRGLICLSTRWPYGATLAVEYHQVEDRAVHFASPATVTPMLAGIKDFVVRRPTKRVLLREWEDGALEDVIREMFWLQHQLGGVGLAAPQIGLSIKLAVIDDKRDDPLVLINPRLVEQSEDTEIGDEGCLSLPGYRGNVRRSTRVSVLTDTLDGRRKRIAATGYLARVIQHEVEHLDGKLYIDRAEGELRRVDPDYLAAKAMARVLGTTEAVT